MDPLSTIASVAGIITAASEAIKILGPYISATKDAPKLAGQLHSELLATRTILTGLQHLAQSFSASLESTASIPSYAPLIPADHVIANFTDGVLLFSELNGLLRTLPALEGGNTGVRVLSSWQWVRKKSAMSTIYTRLQAFKVNMNCILAILQRQDQDSFSNCTLS